MRGSPVVSVSKNTIYFESLITILALFLIRSTKSSEYRFVSNDLNKSQNSTDSHGIIPTEYKLSHNTTKYALRMAASKRIPQEWYKRRKKGFPVPIIKWFREEKYYNIAKKMFEEDFTKEFFNQEKLLKMLEKHYTKKENNCRKIWTVYMFLVWHQVYFQ